MIGFADLIKLLDNRKDIRFPFQSGNGKKAVQIHLLQITVLGNDPTDKTHELRTVLNHKLTDIDQSYLIIQFKHMLGTFIQINSASGNLLYLAVDLVQQLFRLAFPLFAYD